MAQLTKKNRQQLLEFLYENCFKFSDTPTYPLASGLLSRFYIDCKISFSYAKIRTLIGELLYEKIQGVEANAIGGLALGAYPLAIAVSDVAFKYGRDLRAFVVRKEAKAHGLRKILEGDVQKGDRVVIVDDVITSGISTIEAICKSREAGLEVVKVIALIDRQEERGREKIQEQHVDFESIFTIQDLQGMLNEGKSSMAHRTGPSSR